VGVDFQVVDYWNLVMTIYFTVFVFVSVLHVYHSYFVSCLN